MSIARGIAVALAATGTLVLATSHEGFPWIALSLAFSFGFYGLLRKQLDVPVVGGLVVETGYLLPVTAVFLGWLTASGDAAMSFIQGLMEEPEVGKIYTGKVERIVDFGAFVSILSGKDGLVHISQIANQRIEKVTDVLQEGQEVRVLVLDVDNRGRIKLSMKDVEAAEVSGV